MSAQTSSRLGVIQSLLMVAIHAYRWSLSFLLGGQCRFHPTCSSYALDAIRQHGSMRGVSLIVRRLARCHPWHPGGFDPVPLGEIDE